METSSGGTCQRQRRLCRLCLSIVRTQTASAPPCSPTLAATARRCGRQLYEKTPESHSILCESVGSCTEKPESHFILCKHFAGASGVSSRRRAGMRSTPPFGLALSVKGPTTTASENSRLMKSTSATSPGSTPAATGRADREHHIPQNARTHPSTPS